MSRRISFLLALFGVMLIAALLPAASFADPADPPPPPISYSSTGLKPPASLVNPDGRVSAMIELATPAVLAAPNQLNGQSPHQHVAAAQAALMPRLAALDARVLFQTSLVYAGVAVTVPADQLDRLGALPGVARVTVLPPKLPSTSLPSTAAATLPAVTAAATGQGMRIGLIDRGIDYTHADFGGPGTPAAYLANDPNLIEPGTFPTAKVDGFDFAGDNYDASSIAGSATPAPDPDPRECNQPDAHVGQGTNAAGLAAGQGVAADGTPYHGPYGPGADLSTLRIAPGVAPEAQLYALKVFGCHGSTTLLTQAIERAVDPNLDGNPADHLNVLIISIGTPFGSDDDPDAIAVANAVRAGVVVVVAAGDTVETFYSVASPASASLAIAVGATDGSGGIATFSARGPQRGNHALKVDIAAPGVNMRSAAVGAGADAAASSGTAAAAAQVGGAAALLRQLHSTWTPAQIKAALINTATPINAPPSLAGGGQLNLAGLDSINLLAYGADGGGLNYGAPWVAGAWAATRTLQLENTGDASKIVTLAATTAVTETGVILTPPAGPITIPAHSVAQATITMTIDPSGLEFSPDAATATTQDGFARHYLAEHGGSIAISSVASVSGVRVRPAHAAHFGSVDFYLDNQLLDSSLDSREVGIYTSTTPGAHIVKLRKPGASPQSTPLFSAPVTLQDGHDYTLIMVGRPGELGVVTTDENAPAPPPSGQALIHYVNANRVGVNWNIGPLDVYLDGVLQVSALAVGATSAYFPLTPGTHEVLFFHAGANPALGHALAHKTFVASAGQAILLGTGRHDDDDGKIDDDEQRAFIGYGDIRLMVALVERVPFNVFPIVASNAHAAAALNVLPSARSFALGLLNTGARNSGLNGSQATARTPLASAFELEATSPPIAGLSQNTQAADIQYVGVTSSYSVTGNLGLNTTLFFGLSSYGPWSTPNEIQSRIYIDSNQDGRDDFVLLNTNWGTANGGKDSDVFLNGLFPLRADGTLGLAFSYTFWGSFVAPIQSTINIAPFNTAVMFQSVSVTNIALPLDPNNPAGPKGPTPSSFCYHVETRARDASNFQQVVDRVPEAGSPAIAACGNRAGVLRYDILNAAIAPINTRNFIFGAQTAARPIFVDIDGGAITGGVNTARLAARPGTKLLILHHHNAPFPQAEVVDVALPIAIDAPGGRAWMHVPIALR